MIRSLLFAILSLILLCNSNAFQSRLPRSLTTSQRFFSNKPAFGVAPQEHAVASSSTATFLAPEPTHMEAIVSSSSLTVSAATLDPTAFFTDLLSVFLGTPLILAIPIVAALSLVAILVAFVINYASPAVDDD